MASVENFFQSDPPHGLGKRLILKKYLQAYIPIMLPESKPDNKLTIVDGFAGTGRYEDYGWPKEIERYGSPIIALHVAIRHLLKLEFKPSEYEHNSLLDGTVDDMLADLKRSTLDRVTVGSGSQSLSLIFVEAKEQNYKMLFKNKMQTLLIYGLKPRVQRDVRNGVCIIRFDHPESKKSSSEYRIACALICAEFKQLEPPPSPSFAFIDPFGFSYTPWKTVTKFVGYGKEVFFNLMTRDINRFMSAKPEQIGDLFGISAQEVTEWKASMDGMEEKVLQLVDKYQKRLKDAYARFTVNFEMRGLNNARLYHLVFATNHEKGLEVMKEAMNRGTQEANSFRFSDFQIIKKNKPISFLNDQKPEDVAEVLHREFSGRRVPISEVKNFILFDTLYVFRKTPLAILERARKMGVVEPSEKQRRANQYPDHTDWILQFIEQTDTEGKDGREA